MRNKIRGLFGRNKPTADAELMTEADGTAGDIAADVPSVDAAGIDRS